jgi:tetratricopeptide (TPR) repeat protein
MNIFSQIFTRIKKLLSPQSPSNTAEANALDFSLKALKNVRSIGDDNSPWIMGIDKTGRMVIIDRESYEYAQDILPGSNPAQDDLDQLTAAMTRARVLSCGMYRGKAMVSEVVIDTTDVTALASLKDSLKIIIDEQAFTRCNCLGGPTIELYAGQELVATIGLQHGRAIRWNRWKHDAPLQDGNRLTTWLTHNGLDAELLELLYKNQYNNMFNFSKLPYADIPLSRGEQRLRLVENLQRNNDLAGALAECDKILALEPDLPIAYAVRGTLHRSQGNWIPCIEDCTEAIRRGLRYAHVYWTRGVAHDTLGQFAQALADCAIAIEIEPNNAEAYNSRGLIYYRLGKLNEGLADLAEAIRLSPKWSLPYINRGSFHLQRNDWDAAILDCNRAIELIGESKLPADLANLAAAFWNRGQAYHKKGDIKQAEADAKEARRLKPDISPNA